MSSTQTVIFKATYSGVPVYEMPCKGVAVMRRRKDSWLNATQILKVAGFDKPQRTRVLEREVQKGTHEKIQGGYGKYQGTWVPADRGMGLAKAFGVDHLLAPLFDFQPTANASPPLAPKHITAPSVRGRGGKAAIAAARIHALAKQPDKQTRASVDSTSEHSFSLAPIREPSANWPSQSHLARSSTLVRVKANSNLHGSPDNPPDIGLPNRSVPTLPREPRPSPTPSAVSSSSSTPSPLEDLLSQGHPMDSYPSRSKGKEREMASLGLEHDPVRGQKRKYDHGPVEEGYSDGLESHYHDECPSSPMTAKYASLILDYFVSESSQIPDFLIHPPPDFDPNVVIDDDGHTALHWACAMGRMRIVELLLACGADIFRANNAGQTALMRAVMFTNNYELGKFRELFELFSPSTINIDRNDRTVFHYVVDIALSKGKVQAARYYLETILERLAVYPKELADILNFQDEDGESALTLAARCRSKRLVRILLDHGANPKTVNREGKSAEDYILEDDQFRMLEPEAGYLVGSDGGGEETQSVGSINRPLRIGATTEKAEVVTPSAVEHVTPPVSPATVGQVRCSKAGQRIAREAGAEMGAMIEALGSSFDGELEEKERDLLQADKLLRSIEVELAEGRRKIAGLEKVLWDFGEKKRLVGELEEELGEKMGKRYRFGWEKYVRDEEEREKKFVEQHREFIGGLVQAGGGTEMRMEELLVSSESEEASGAIGRLRALERENGDLVGLLEVPKEIEAECEGLRESVRGLCKERESLFREFINLASENGESEEEVGAGSGDGKGSRLNRYRRLVSLGCGGIELEEVDEVIESFGEGIEVNAGEGKVSGSRTGGGGRRQEKSIVGMNGIEHTTAGVGKGIPGEVRGGSKDDQRDGQSRQLHQPVGLQDHQDEKTRQDDCHSQKEQEKGEEAIGKEMGKRSQSKSY